MRLDFLLRGGSILNLVEENDKNLSARLVDILVTDNQRSRVGVSDKCAPYIKNLDTNVRLSPKNFSMKGCT